MSSTTFRALALCVLTSLASAQITKAPLSPRLKLEQQIGLAQVTLDYGRPGVKGREIFGALEPYGKVWRTGANSGTKIGFDREVRFGDELVPAGLYGLYTIPEKKSWTVILNRNTKLWGAGGYDPAQDQLRIVVPVEKRKELQETLAIDFEGFHANGGDLVISWEHVRVRVPVFVDSDEEVLAEIDEKVRTAEGEVSAQSYFDAAMFLYEKDRDLEDAIVWMDRSVELRPNAFWQRYYLAELSHHMGDDETAKEAARKALEQAKQSRGGDFGYVAKCELLLARLR